MCTLNSKGLLLFLFVTSSSFTSIMFPVFLWWIIDLIKSIKGKIKGMILRLCPISHHSLQLTSSQVLLTFDILSISQPVLCSLCSFLCCLIQIITISHLIYASTLQLDSTSPSIFNFISHNQNHFSNTQSRFIPLVKILLSFFLVYRQSPKWHSEPFWFWLLFTSQFYLWLLLNKTESHP